MKRCRVASLPSEGDWVALDDVARHHLLHVMRLQPGDRVCLYDGQGSQAEATLESQGEALGARLLSDPEQVQVREVHLVIGLLKGPAMDAALRMATEAGVTAIHPFQARRSVAKGTKATRLERIVRSAAEQCGRADLPVVHPVGTLDDALEATRHLEDRRVCLPGADHVGPATRDAAVLIGPEGGLDPREVQRALDDGWQPTGLTRWTLRASTAAVVAVAMCAGTH
jgi:16S rRNA (uracil1498-N3)-methyltransferase